MFEKFLFRSLAAVVAAALLVTSSYGDVFNMGPGLTSLEMVPVGDPGNAGEWSGESYGGYGLDGICGAVDYAYNIGKYEVTNAQWREFLTAKASVTDPHGFYNTRMGETFGGIDRTWSVDHYVYTAKDGDANWDDRPANYVSFWDAARFSNWLQNGQGDGDTETGAYINLDNQDTFARQSGARYFIPTENEWYKSAYYDPNKGGVGIPGYWDYPMMSDIPTVPSNDVTTPDGGNNASFSQNGYADWQYYTTLVGEFELSDSPYGTFDQGGNLWEWNETAIDSVYDGPSRGMRGGRWNTDSDSLLASYRFTWPPTREGSSTTFRVASVPEPGSITLLVCGLVTGLIWWRRRK